jgi:competence protein ComEA
MNNALKSMLVAAAFACFSPLVFAGKPVNVNTATAVELADSLDGIGEAKAKAIVEYRTKNGAFKSATQLSEVKGIGEKTVAKNVAFIKLSAAK